MLSLRRNALLSIYSTIEILLNIRLSAEQPFIPATTTDLFDIHGLQQPMKSLMPMDVNTMGVVAEIVEWALQTLKSDTDVESRALKTAIVNASIELFENP